ncbi:MAG: hypothetical protein B6D73_18270 [gamma proteobacterium symbiont of Stewartia floridana]|nr:MAG: hypothetical protein B6D73_18270 [gamma proteobacterium symbiont of Stewartia floridana]
MEDNDTTSELQQLFFAFVGNTLLQYQLLEQSIKGIRNWSALVEADWNYEDLISFSPRKKETLGAAIHSLRKILNLSPEFEEKLFKVLENRNRFAHSYIEGKDRHLENQEELFEYIAELQEQIIQVQEMNYTFHAFQRMYNEKHVPSNIIEALGANRMDREIDRRVEAFKSQVSESFGVDMEPKREG